MAFRFNANFSLNLKKKLIFMMNDELGRRIEKKYR